MPEKGPSQILKPQLRHDNIWNNSKQRAKSSRGSHGEGPTSHRLVLLLVQKLAYPRSKSADQAAANSLRPYQEGLDGVASKASFEQRQ